MKDIAVIIETIINTSVASVWQALTDNRKMNEWYFDIESFK